MLNILFLENYRVSLVGFLKNVYVILYNIINVWMILDN